MQISYFQRAVITALAFLTYYTAINILRDKYLVVHTYIIIMYVYKCLHTKL